VVTIHAWHLLDWDFRSGDVELWGRIAAILLTRGG